MDTPTRIYKELARLDSIMLDPIPADILPLMDEIGLGVFERVTLQCRYVLRAFMYGWQYGRVAKR